MTATKAAPVRELRALLAGLGTAPRDLLLSDITLDSRRAIDGSAFLACRGRGTHGLEFAGQAVGRGARAILWEPGPDVEVPDFPSDIVVACVPDLARHAGTLADRFFGEPSASLDVIGVTGTNGKTTCAYLLAQALQHVGREAAYVGTIGVGRVGQLEPASLTTADAVTVQRNLAQLLQSGVHSVAMEVSSHALDQHRVGGVRFRSAAFTNLTRDHLDYHETMAGYGAAKAKLLEWPGLDARVINVDDDFGAELAGRSYTSGEIVRVTRRAASAQSVPGDAWVALRTARQAASGLHLAVDSSWGAADFATRLVGDFNIDNALIVYGLLCALGVDVSAASAALSRVSAPSGRMESFGGDAQPLVIVDYAHTPDALDKALRAARAHCAGRLTVVFGCGGDRDPGKRPLMGGVAARLADCVIVTDDNPRTESPAKIVADIIAGLTTRKDWAIEHDRARAIETAIRQATPGDVVVIAGKGHEDYQLYGSERRAFSDQAVVRRSLPSATAGAE
jgi:UDP-N-acetylmuramoyl-L-alanyl-D-glutamate--2,6-diaminopimelate ligase